MFTGIVTDIGIVKDIRAERETRLTINAPWQKNEIALGASIACSGVCLTVVENGDGWFAVEASQETLRCTTIGEWKSGTQINLERALRAADELGGHLVSGHVDGLATIVESIPVGDSRKLTIQAPAALKAFIAAKGSVTLDGVSLTVNDVKNAKFDINVIPHTLNVTTLGTKNPGDKLNLEVDLMARYVARILETR